MGGGHNGIGASINEQHQKIVGYESNLIRAKWLRVGEQVITGFEMLPYIFKGGLSNGEAVLVEDILKTADGLKEQNKQDLYVLCKEFKDPITLKEEGFNDFCKLFIPRFESQEAQKHLLQNETCCSSELMICDPQIEFYNDMLGPEVAKQILAKGYKQPVTPQQEIKIDKISQYERYLDGKNAYGYNAQGTAILLSGFKMFYELTLDVDKIDIIKDPDNSNLKLHRHIMKIYNNLGPELKKDLEQTCDEVQNPKTSREKGFVEVCKRLKWTQDGDAATYIINKHQQCVEKASQHLSEKKAEQLCSELIDL